MDAIPFRIGQVNGAGAADALFLKVFGGEVMAAYEIACKTTGKQMVRTIQHGRSAAFPATWRVNARYHTPGSEIRGQVSNVNERTITIDDALLSDVFIPNVDEAKNHFDYRSTYSTEAGRSLAYQQDRTILGVGILAARAAATITGGVGGFTVASPAAEMRTDANTLVNAIQSAMQNFDEKNIPETDEKFAFMLPAQYYLLTGLKDLVDRDFSDSNGDLAKAEVLRVKGATLVKTNMLPQTAITTGPVPYQGDFTKSVALVMTKAAVGTVQLWDLQTEMQYDIRRQGTLIVAKYLKGHGILRPECAAELRVA